MREALRPSGVDASKYSGHSFRIGAATAALPHKDPREVAELGVPALHPGASRKTGSSLQETVHIIEGGRRTVTRMNTITNIVHLIFVGGSTREAVIERRLPSVTGVSDRYTQVLLVKAGCWIAQGLASQSASSICPPSMRRVDSLTRCKGGSPG